MVPPLKILSDFDGVWTETHHEADVLHDQLVTWCAELLGPRSVVEADLAALRDEVRERPDAYGWAPDGRISAFSDEDPLCELAGLCHRLASASASSGTARRYRDAIERRYTTVARFGELAFVAAMARFRAERPPTIVPDAREQLERVRRAGAEVVVVSNSEPEKLRDWFRSVGIDAGEQPGHALRIRGSAGKQVLGGDEAIDVGGRRVHVDRPRYRATLEQERPALVIGDIFSLDLSLPHRMRTLGHPAAPRTLVLRRLPHSPPWAARDRAAGAIDHVVEHFGDLAPLIARQES